MFWQVLLLFSLISYISMPTNDLGFNSFCIGYRSDIRCARDLDRPSSAKCKASYVFPEAQPTGD